MDLEFQIPITLGDLLNPSNDIYYVKNIYTIDDIPRLLMDVKNQFSNKDPFKIIPSFETFYAVLDNSARIPLQNLFRTFDLLYRLLDDFGHDLVPPLEKELADEQRQLFLKSIKMGVYLLCSLIKVIDKNIFDGKNPLNSKKGKNQELESINITNWEGKRFDALVQIYNLIQLPLEKLWNPPVVEEPFTNLFCDVCYRTLEQNIQKKKHVGDTVFQILGNAVKRYSHALVFPDKILQILRQYEHAIPVITSGINLLIEEFGMSSIFGTFIREVIEELHIDAADSQTSKNFGIFLNELTAISPKLMAAHLSKISEELLNSKSYTLRICILKMLGDVILFELTSEELSEEDRITRDDFLDKLFDHTQDVNSYVRSKVLSIVFQLKERNAIPLAYQTKILKLAIERLEDKSSGVRKNALVLVKTFLEMNPYSAKLTSAELNEKFVMESKKLEEIHEQLINLRKNATVLDEKFNELQADIELHILDTRGQIYPQTDFSVLVDGTTDLNGKVKEYLYNGDYSKACKLQKIIGQQVGHSENIDQLEPGLYVEYYMILLRECYIGENDCKPIMDEFAKQEKIVEFLKDSIEFSTIIFSCLPKLEQMLMSTSNSDVVESINVLTTGFLFGIKDFKIGMTKILNLVWSTDKEKRDAVVTAYHRVLFVTDKDGRAHALKVVYNLCNFLEHLTLGFYKAFEVLVREWISSDDINNQIIQVMFEVFSLKIESPTQEEDSRKALQLLVIASGTKNAIASANLTLFKTIGLQERGSIDHRIYTATLSLLMNMHLPEKTTNILTRLEKSNEIVIAAVDTYKILFFKLGIDNFDPVTSKLFDFIYHLVQAPDLLAEQIIFDIIKQLEEKSNNLLNDTERNNNDGPLLKLPIQLIVRVIHLIGYLAMKEMIFLDIEVYKNIKYRQELNELKKQKKDKRNTMQMNISASSALKRLSETGSTEQNPEEEEGNHGATADDRIAEIINHLCEKVVLNSDEGIFKRFKFIILDIGQNPQKYDNELLFQAAVLTIIRFMLVSIEFCEEHMHLLMNILTGTKNITIKQNIIIGMTDLMFRYPNVIGLWSKQFYAMLHDENDKVRLTTVKMLSHLIMQEMIKVKGQISDLALCIVDDNEIIRTVTQQFFKEIAAKPNTLYNILPDIIARLGDPSLNLEEEKYRTVMRHIFGLVEKNRQVEGLVDKLCYRFKTTREEREWRDAVYCLSLLNHTEKTIRKLIEHIPLYKDKVQCDEVYNTFKLIIKNTSTRMALTARQETKDILKEFEIKLDECLEVDNGNREPMIMDDGSVAAPGTMSTKRKPQQSKKTNKSRGPVRRGAARGRKVDDSDDESSEESSSSSEDEAPPKTQTKGRKLPQSSDSGSDDNDEHFKKPAAPRNIRGRGRTRR